MSVTQTVEIPVSHRLTIEVPREVPTGRAILTFTPALAKKPADLRSTDRMPLPSPLPGGNARTIEEALKSAEEKAKDPNRRPISELFGKCPGFFGGDGVAYQRAIRDEWD